MDAEMAWTIGIIVSLLVTFIVHRVIQKKKEVKEYEDSLPKGVMVQCGWCYKFRINGKWTYSTMDFGLISHGCCPECLKTLNDALDEMERKNDARH